MFGKFRRWRSARIRFLFQWGPPPHYPFYVRLTPFIGFSIPWFKTKQGEITRLRWAFVHGLQVVVWNGRRWVVRRQIAPWLFGRSKVKGEAFHGSVRNT